VCCLVLSSDEFRPSVLRHLLPDGTMAYLLPSCSVFPSRVVFSSFAVTPVCCFFPFDRDPVLRIKGKSQGGTSLMREWLIFPLHDPRNTFFLFVLTVGNNFLPLNPLSLRFASHPFAAVPLGRDTILIAGMEAIPPPSFPR